MLRVAVTGVSGKMGLCLINAVNLSQHATLNVAVSRTNSTILGKNVGNIAGITNLDLKIVDSLSDVIDQFDTLIDFTRPEASMEYLKTCHQAGKQIVIGTTGFSYKQKVLINKVAKDNAIVFSPNMSTGINLSFKLLEMAAKVLGETADIEVIEAHHRNKIDAPSGTALRMGEIIANTLGRNLSDYAIYNRQTNHEIRKQKTIGFSTIRAGDIVGEHTVMFADSEERIEITHKASSRMTFAKGAVKAAVWLQNKSRGLYNMQDVLGLS